MNGRGEGPLFMVSLDQKLMGWGVPIFEACHIEKQSFFWAVAEGNSSTNRCLLESSAPWDKEPASNKNFPTIISFLERHFPQVFKGKKTVLHEMEFRRDDFAVHPLLPQIILVRWRHFLSSGMLHFSVTKGNAPSLSTLLVATWWAETKQFYERRVKIRIHRTPFVSSFFLIHKREMEIPRGPIICNAYPGLEWPDL